MIELDLIPWQEKTSIHILSDTIELEEALETATELFKQLKEEHHDTN